MPLDSLTAVGTDDILGAAEVVALSAHLCLGARSSCRASQADALASTRKSIAACLPSVLLLFEMSNYPVNWHNWLRDSKSTVP